MKRLLLILLCLPLATYAQLQGIGEFKINKTIVSVLDTLAKQNNLNIKETYKDIGSLVDLENPPGFLKDIYELKKDTTSHGSNDYHSVMQNNVRVFYLNYLIIGGVDIRDIYLTFYKDTLVKFCCESSVHNSEFSIGEAFKEKYGKPKEDHVEKKPVVCQNGFGVVFNYENYSHYSSWFPKSRITAQELLGVSYDDCKAFSVYYFKIRDQVKDNKISSIETKLADMEKVLKKKNFVGSLKSF